MDFADLVGTDDNSWLDSSSSLDSSEFWASTMVFLPACLGGTVVERSAANELFLVFTMLTEFFLSR